MSCDPANPRRSQVPGPESVKLATEDCVEVGDQAPTSVNVTGNNHILHDQRNKKAEALQGSSRSKVYTQQVFHKGLFVPRARSSSFHGTTASNEVDSNLSQSQSATQRQIECEEVNSQSHNANIQPPSWQRVPSMKKRKIDALSPPPIVTHTSNRFSGLQLDEPTDDSFVPPKMNKPPPIVLYGIEDVNELTTLIRSVIQPNDFRFKVVNKNLLRVMVNTAENYKTAIYLIRQKGLIAHTFSRKETKCYRIVIKHLHHTTPHSAIVEEIERTGNKVRGEIINARFGPDKKPTSTFFVNVEPDSNNKAVKNIQCVKCGEGHKTSDCLKKDRNTPAKCALCSCDHPANYKGCQVYREILSRKTIHKHAPSKPNKQKAEIAAPIAPLPQPTQQKSFVEAVKNTPTFLKRQRDETTNVQSSQNVRKAPKQPSDNNHSQQIIASDRNSTELSSRNDISQTHQPTTVEQVLIRQSQKIDQLLEQISTLLGLLTAIIPKLIK
ncbi:hypothetical protein ABMA28_015354 [Loxostege sticticalis]|uniref:Gag-like protein n=1 Tax=Loxostege sticticalis TaxID=481309 RepID=A0ABD0TCX2_LOXSC